MITRLALLLITTLVAAGATARAPTSPSPYTNVISSGPFGLPSNARSVDWFVVNDSPDSQIVRVTVYRLGIGIAKTPVPPGALTITLLPNYSSHNANNVSATGPFRVGEMYEVVVELNDKRVLPSVDVWRLANATIIPGTHLSPQDFSDIK